MNASSYVVGKNLLGSELPLATVLFHLPFQVGNGIECIHQWKAVSIGFSNQSLE